MAARIGRTGGPFFSSSGALLRQLVGFLGRFLQGGFPLHLGDGFHKAGGRLVHEIFVFEMDAGIALELVDIVQHLRCRLIPLGGILLHGLDGDFLQALGDGGVDFPRQLRLGLQLHNGHRHRAVRFKGKTAGQHFIQHDAGGIDIRFFVGDIPPRLFRADIMHGTDRLVGGARRADFIAGEPAMPRSVTLMVPSGAA